MGTSAGGGIGNVVSFKAESNLSAKQYHGVRLTAANTAGTSSIAGTDRILGVLVNKPSAAGVPADVQIDGVAKVITSIAVSAGDLLICGTDAKFAKIAAADLANSFIAAQALEASTADGDIISARLLMSVGTTS
jgi:hypothetical protein